jgi:O-antigen ligase
MVLYALLWLLFNYYMSQGATKQFVLRGFRFASWGVKGAPGWFENSGEFGIEMCIFLPLAWHYYLASKPYLTKWRRLFVLGMPITAIIGIVGSSSRGAEVGLAGVGLWMLARTKYFFRTVAAVVVLGTLTWFITPAEQKQRWSESGEDSTSTRRMTYWRAGIDMTRQYPVLGVGYGNWIEYYGDHYVDAEARRGSIGIVQLSHNIFIQCMAELGLTGLSVLLMMMTATFFINHQTRKLARAGPGPPRDFTLQMAYGLDGALIGFIGSGFFVTVLYYPYFWINLAFTVALHDIARRDRKRASAPALALGGVPAPPGAPAVVAPAALPRLRR